MAERIGVYPGSFDPPTFGHLDMIRRAAKLFDTLIVAVARNTDKHGMFMTDERKAMLREITKDIPNVRIDHFAGLTVDQFQRRTSVVEYTRASLKKSLQTVRKFAELEGLDAHGRSASIRLEAR